VSVPAGLLGGVDEAGRGPLAGPVVAAAVVLPEGRPVAGVRDSKKLAPARRAELAIAIRADCVSWCVASASVAEIDALNILGATLLAMRRAVAGLDVRPDRLRVDGNRLPSFGTEYADRAETLVGGDDICPAIGAASILAKVARDDLMVSLHQRYPRYGFDRHKGYPTRQHLAALAEFGVSPEHRMSFAPVQRAAQRSPVGGGQ